MADRIEITVESQALTDLLQRLAQRTGDLSPLMGSIANDMLDEVEENFEQQGRPKWKPLAESTIERREKLGYWPGKILQMRGELAAAVQTFSSANEAGVSVAKTYAAIHQFGGQAGRGKKTTIPARPFLGLSEEALKGISRRIEEWLSGG